MKEFHTRPREDGESSDDGAIEAWKQLRDNSNSPTFDALRETLSNLDVPTFELPELARPATEQQAAEQTEHLAEMRILVAALNQTMKNAEADRKRSEQDHKDQKLFNERMTKIAVALSFAAVIAPFLIYWLEHGWWWEQYRP